MHHLIRAAAGIHAADQLLLAALPLIGGLVLHLEPSGIAALVAMPGFAWLLASLPAGVLVDRWPRRRVLLLAVGLVLGGQLAAMLGLPLGAGALGLAALLASLGTVIFVLAAGATVPVLAAREGFAGANAKLELARAGASLLAPILAGWCAARGLGVLALGLGALGAMAALLATRGLPALPPPPARHAPILQGLKEGAGFLARQPLLRAVFGCALCWNFGFFAWLAAVVPYALNVAGLSAASTGAAQAGYGLGMLLGAASAPWLLRGTAPALVLLGGPGVSVLAAPLLLGAPGAASLALAAFLLGFGPMQWAIAQVSLRQAVTPPELLGRVGASLQLAIYGVRPLGALSAGAVMAAWGPGAGIALAGCAFLASFLVSAASPLARLRVMPG